MNAIRLVSSVLHPQRDPLYPKGFGAVLRPMVVLRTASLAMQVLQRYEHLLRDHGAILLERDRVDPCVAQEIVEDGKKPETERQFRKGAKGLSAQMIHVHVGSRTDLASPFPNDVKTVFCNRKTQRRHIKTFLGTPEGDIAMQAYEPLRRILRRIDAGDNRELDSLCREFYDGEYDKRNTGRRKIIEARAAPGIKIAQEEVSRELLPVDWNDMFGCSFGDVPHARDVRTETAREAYLYAYTR
jgi:hypothetical protein